MEAQSQRSLKETLPLWPSGEAVRQYGAVLGEAKSKKAEILSKLGFFSPQKIETRVWQILSVKGQIVNILDFVGYAFSVMITQLSHSSMKAAIDL